MADSVQPHRQKPTRLPHPWDSPGKNTGVGCHFLLQCMKVKGEREVAQLCPTLSDPMDCSPPGSSILGIFQTRALEWAAIAFSHLLARLVLFYDLLRNGLKKRIHVEERSEKAHTLELRNAFYFIFYYLFILVAPHSMWDLL